MKVRQCEGIQLQMLCKNATSTASRNLRVSAAARSDLKRRVFRSNARWPAINRWFEALEMRETYMATKSDFYTHVRDIPPQ